MAKIITVFCLLTTVFATGQFEQHAHPRLWLRGSDASMLRQKIAQDPLAAEIHRAAIKQADAILDARTCRYEIADGRRLLGESRRALTHTMHCAWAWQFTRDPKYLNRAIAELEAACAMDDWNPSHFLDVAEMSTAVAIGYDWLYPALDASQRAMCEAAIRDKGLLPAKKLYDQDAWWTHAHNNWAQVCGGGIALAAIAVQGHDEGLSAEIIQRGINLVEKCKHFYQPDGLYPEGPGYWHYGTNYHVMLLAALETLEYPVKVPEFFEKSGNSMIHLHGPTLLPFNFADGKARIGLKSPAQSWIASHFNNPAQAQDVRDQFQMALTNHWDIAKRSSTPLHVLWFPQPPTRSQRLPKHAVFNGEQSVAVFRSNWEPRAAWLAIKGGTSMGGHSHMDVGSFCYDAKGIRWIHDLGNDNYNMPGYFGSKRFEYYRLQNRSHNTLEIAEQLQGEDSKPCPIISSSLDGTPVSATLDLSNAYLQSAGKVIRSVQFHEDSGAAIITDEITSPAGNVIWRAMTDARAILNGDTVTLHKEGESITLTLLSADGTWSIEKATPPTPIENQNVGFQAISLTVPQKNRISIQVEIRP